jgi:serine/threonine-protein kinase
LSDETLIHPKDSGRPSTPGARRLKKRAELPADLLRQATGRLRALCYLYAIVFVLADFVPTFYYGRYREFFFSSFAGWGPATISIALALLVAALTYTHRIRSQHVMDIGLLFGAVGSYGIAFAQYLGYFSTVDPSAIERAYLGLSWVAPWMLFFSVLIPNQPFKTLIANLVSASAVPVVITVVTHQVGIRLPLTASQHFLGLVFPYLLVVMMSFAAARVVYRLGTDVGRAREMGSYRLIDLIGRGGMGEVWKAKHRMLARPAAIKLVRPEALGGEMGEDVRLILKRFEHEAQATAAMRSPHTIVLYDYGVSDDGTFYYVMELLDGFDSNSLVRRFGPMPPERAVHILSQVCHSLGEAHEKGLIHRDIKPANVYVCRYGRELDFVKILDFGLVKEQHKRAEDVVTLTAANVTSGTPAFMAPEQILGNQTVDARTDLYAVGCLAHWLLTGQLVFHGETAMATMMHHVQTPPTPISQLVEQTIPSELEAAILSCLQKDPKDRPQSADALAALLDRCRFGESWTQKRARHWWDAYRPSAP